MSVMEWRILIRQSLMKEKSNKEKEQPSINIDDKGLTNKKPIKFDNNDRARLQDLLNKDRLKSMRK